VNLDIGGTPVSVSEDDIGDGGADKGNWNSVSITSPLEVRIPGATGIGSDNVTDLPHPGFRGNWHVFGHNIVQVSEKMVQLDPI
jgi:hypothetical protein